MIAFRKKSILGQKSVIYVNGYNSVRISRTFHRIKFHIAIRLHLWTLKEGIELTLGILEGKTLCQIAVMQILGIVRQTWSGDRQILEDGFCQEAWTNLEYY